MKKFYFRKIVLITFGALVTVVSATAANWNKSNQTTGWILGSNTHPTLASLKLNSMDGPLDGHQVLKFTISHGACGGDERWSDCSNDRQRIEAVYDDLDLNNRKSQLKERYYRTNLFIPSEAEFPDTAPMSQMIHQLKIKNKNQRGKEQVL